MEVGLELTDAQPINFSVNKLDQFTDTIDYHFKKRTFLKYDDDSSCQPPGLVEADSINSSIFSAGNASFSITHECFEMEVEEPRYNYHGPKIVLPKHECPVTICSADTIGTVKSRQLLQVLFDSGSMVSMIKRPTLPPKAVTKTISEIRDIATPLAKSRRRKL
jgi:hypothetical protein